MAGLLGRVIAFIMAREPGAESAGDDALALIGRIKSSTSMRTWAQLTERPPAPRRDVSLAGFLRADGRDRSATQPSAIEAARVDVVLATVESLPFSDDVFDKVLCVHVLYFWKISTCAA